MSGLHDIKSRIKAVRETQQIASAMEMISVSKMKKAVRLLESNNPYFNRLYPLMREIAANTKDTPYFDFKQAKNPVYIIISADKSMCGGFNHKILRFAEKALEASKSALIIPVGHTAAAYFSKYDNINHDFVQLAYAPDEDLCRGLAEFVLSIFGKSADRINLLFTRMGNVAAMTPEMLTLLPVEPLYKTDRQIEYEPDMSAVLDKIIPDYITGMLYGALLHSAAGEHTSRHNAMAASNTNAEALIKELVQKYNKVRQEGVTNEIEEIISSGINRSK